MFDKNIEPNCAYCRYATDLGYDEYFCVRRGIMEGIGSCGRFRYEPTKRKPPSMPALKESGFTEEDFSIEA